MQRKSGLEKNGDLVSAIVRATGNGSSAATVRDIQRELKSLGTALTSSEAQEIIASLIKTRFISMHIDPVTGLVMITMLPEGLHSMGSDEKRRSDYAGKFSGVPGCRPCETLTQHGPLPWPFHPQAGHGRTKEHGDSWERLHAATKEGWS